MPDEVEVVYGAQGAAPGARGEAELLKEPLLGDAGGAAAGTGATGETGATPGTGDTGATGEAAEGGEKKEEDGPKVSYGQLFRFADGTDKCLMTLGAIGATINGCGLPAFSYVFGKMLSTLADDPDDIDKWAMWMAIAGGGVMLAAGVQMACWTSTGERQADKIRLRYFDALLRQEPGWHDGQATGSLTSRLHGDTEVILAGVGDKVGMAVQNTAMFVSAYVVGFVASWRLTLIIMSTAPLIAFGGWLMQYSMTKLSDVSRNAYAGAGAIAEETLASIRTVYAFNGQESAIARYVEHLDTAKRAGIRKGFVQGAGVGFVTFVMFGSYGISFYYASWLIEWGLNDVGDVLTCFFSVLMGSFAIGQVAQPIAAMTTARAAAHKVFGVLDRQPAVQSGARTLPNLQGQIEFCAVGFRYPSRMEHWVFKGLDLRIDAGKKVALVGSSGCGKSSCVSMLQRFYDPEEGQVLVDGVPLRDLDLKWWRQQVGIVTQEPILFSGTIADNVRLGLPGSDWAPGDAVPPDDMAKIERACRDAQIHDIIVTRFGDLGYRTWVGEGGGRLSGGQKQRIAIARAIVKDPRILLLDEATSALDRKHEREVQLALNRAMERRTTVIVAHRLTTIRNADNIVVIRPPGSTGASSVMKGSITKRGSFAGAARQLSGSGLAGRAGSRQLSTGGGKEWSRIAEMGTHDELMERNGDYARLFRAQMSGRNRSSTLAGEAEAEVVAVDAAADAHEIEAEASPEPSPMALSGPAGAGDEAEKKGKKGGGFMRVAGMSRPWTGWVVLGVFGAFLNGMVYPGYAIIFSKVINVFGKTPEKAKEDGLVWAMLFIAVGAMSFIGYILENGCFAVAGENLTVRLRRDLFRNMLRQDLAFYDRPGRESGSLSSVLSGKTEVIYKLFGPSIGMAFRTMSTLLVGFAIAFYISWELTLIILSAVPVMAIAGYLNVKVYAGQGMSEPESEKSETGKASMSVGRISSEAISNLKTVIAFNSQEFFMREMTRLVTLRGRKLVKKATLMGCFFGFSQFVMFGAFALSLWYGGKMMDKGRMPESDPLNLHDTAFGGVTLVTMAVIMSAMGVGETAGMQSAGIDAGEASVDVFEMLDAQPVIDQMSDSRDDGGVTQGAVHMHGVDFAYPTRPQVKVLDGITIPFTPGRATALIGDTGCGKSTVMQLLLRFYQPSDTGGAITVDGHNLSDLNLRYWRSQVGLVSQEPVLFTGTVEENIKLGRPGATYDDVREAAQRARVHDFIMQMPDKYQTKVGQKGSQLSGGQKQRVAIARALIKRPRVLLLDEATSALDNTSEREVQAALDAIIAAGGMTTVEIAHRMTTIEGADSIAVLQQGQVLEQGSHKELMQLDGDYKNRYDLYHSLA